MVALFDAVCQRTAQNGPVDGVGFVHGVMNTDNMSILGLTIDYVPWLDRATRLWVDPNTTDAQKTLLMGSTRHRNWNLSRLAQALYPMIEEVPPLQACLDRYRNGSPQLQCTVGSKAWP